MLGRIVEVAQDSRHLSAYRGFMLVRDADGNRTELGRVPLDDMAALIVHAHGVSYTNNLLVALAERGVPMVLCGATHQVVGVLWPFDSNFEVSKRIQAQIDASKPMHKRAWTMVVRAKLEQQARLLQQLGKPYAPLDALVTQVRSGDPQNIEAQGARRYWTLLFGTEFRRDRTEPGTNAMLNYGYTVLRATTARAIAAAGLHPSIGMHHCNAANAYRLVDDLMEPFRPVIDEVVWEARQNGQNALVPEVKTAIAQAMSRDMPTLYGVTPLMGCVNRLAVSVAQYYAAERNHLELPLRSAHLINRNSADLL